MLNSGTDSNSSKGEEDTNPTSNTQSAEQPATPISQHDYFNLLGNDYLDKVASLFPRSVICDREFNRLESTETKLGYLRNRVEKLIHASRLEELADDQTALSEKDIFFINVGINSLVAWGDGTDKYAISTLRDVTPSMDTMQVLAFFYGVGLLLKQNRSIPNSEGHGGLRGFMNYYIKVFEHNHSTYMENSDPLMIE